MWAKPEGCRRKVVPQRTQRDNKTIWPKPFRYKFWQTFCQLRAPCLRVMGLRQGVAPKSFLFCARFQYFVVFQWVLWESWLDSLPEYLLFIMSQNKSNMYMYVTFRKKDFCKKLVNKYIHIWSVINWAIKCKVLNKLFGDFQKSCGQALKGQAFQFGSWVA